MKDMICSDIMSRRTVIRRLNGTGLAIVLFLED